MVDKSAPGPTSTVKPTVRSVTEETTLQRSTAALTVFVLPASSLAIQGIHVPAVHQAAMLGRETE